MMENQYSEPAFPWAQYDGMTLRDYFAAKAMLLCEVDQSNIHGMAKFAYEVADAMLKARQQ